MRNKNNSELKSAFESFSEFQEKVKKCRIDSETEIGDLTESDLKSGAVLNFLNNRSHLQVSDLVGALPFVHVCADPNWQQQFWSNVAGDLPPAEARVLIENYLPPEKVIFNEYKLILTFALKNDVAWEHYKENLSAMMIPAKDMLVALSKVPHVDEKFMPLLHQVLGENLTKVYLENKDLIDRTPLKHHIVELNNITQSWQANFLDAFTSRLKKLTVYFGQDPDDWGCLSKALEKEGFREEAAKLLQKMLAEKEKYAHLGSNNHNNEFVRDSFPEFVERINNVFSFDINREFVQSVVGDCFREAKIRKLLQSDEEFKNEDSRLIEDIAKERPDDMEQVKKVIRLFHKINERPGTYGSEYNKFYPRVLVPLVKRDLPEWMYPVVARAINNNVLSTDRLGSREALFDAAKAWKINPKIWKKDAEKIGRMPLEARIVAGAVFDKVTADQKTFACKEEMRECFWNEMKKAQDMGWKQAIVTYCEDNAETRGRILSAYHPELSDEMQSVLRASAHINDLVNLDMNKINNNADLWNIYLGIDKRLMFLPANEECQYGSQYRADLIRGLVAFDSFFPNEDFKLKYLEAVYYIEGGYDLCLPCDLNPEKRASFAAFLEKNLFYDDGFGKEAIRPEDQLNDIGKIWGSLTPEQEKFNFDKLLGLCYTQESVEHIEDIFKAWERDYNYDDTVQDISRRQKRYFRGFRRPHDLRLYQKLLVGKIEPRSQEALDVLLALNRREGMAKAAEYLDVRRHFIGNRDKRAFVDLTVGNDAQINDYERQQIARFSASVILSFQSKQYKEIVDKIVDLVVEDPQASALFRKHYVDVVSETSYSDNPDVINLRGHYQRERAWISSSAVRCMLCFGDNYQRYFNKIAKHNISIKKQIKKHNPHASYTDLINIHDALYWLPDNLKKEDRTSFMGYIDRHLFYQDGTGVERHRSLSDFEIVAKAWSSLSEEDRQKDFEDLLAHVRSKKYVDCKYATFGEEAALHGISEAHYKEVEKIYEQGLQVPELLDSSKRFVFGELTGRFLPRDDPRVGFFGEHTNCCQHFNGAGKACAISSVRDPFSQLFVVEKSDGSIIAGSWVWESKIEKDGQYFKAFCFDNIEAKGDYKWDSRVTEVYKLTLPYLAELNYAKVTVGMGNQDGNVAEFPDTECIPLNRNYSGYTDAKEQKLMLDNPKATPVDYNEGDIYVTGALVDDIPVMREISARCFPKGDQELQVPEDDPQGLVLRDKGKIVGYVIFSEKEHHIYDMAVLPEYRSKKLKSADGQKRDIQYKGGNRSSSLILLEAMAKKIRQLGKDEEWSAELRDATSLKYMQFMAARGLVDLKLGGVDHEMSDGTKVISVKFSIKEKPQEERRQMTINPNIRGGR